jgi:type IV secretory pathway TrbF-like protein
MIVFFTIHGMLNLRAQAPQKMSYQAVIRNGSNQLIANTNVGMQISILQGSPTGTPVYVETQNSATNINGLVSIEVGAGTVVSGSFSTIDWSTGSYFIKTETDPTGGTTYTITGTSQLLSVPYAFYAGNVAETDPAVSSGSVNFIPTWNGTTLTDGTIQDNGSEVGVGTAPVPGNQLTVAGKTSTTDFQMSNGAANTYILQSDANGNASWVNPTTLTVPENDPQVSSTNTNSIPRWNGTVLTDGIIQDDATNLGVGTAPVAGNKITVAGKTATTNFQMTNGASNTYILQSDASGNATWINPTTLPITETDPQVNPVTNNVVPRWNGTSLVDGIIQDNSNSIGIGTAPVAANKVTVAGKTATTDFQMTSGAATNYVLQSDASGNATWVNPTALTITETDPQVNSATTNMVPRYNGTSLVDGVIQDNATNIGIGTAPVAANKVTVAGKTSTTNFQMTNGAAINYVLQSDASGNATWVNPTSLSISETDPQVSSATTNYIPKWNGTSLVDGLLLDNGTNIGVGIALPTAKMHVVGNIKIDAGKLPFVNTGESVFIGDNAGLNDDLTSNFNVFIGQDAGKLNTTGSSNVFIGHLTGDANTTGQQNTAIGQGTMGANTTGVRNTSFGAGSLATNISGTDNTTIGQGALGSCITANQSTIVGAGAFRNSTTSNTNVALGNAAGYTNLTGNGNIFIGYAAGYYELGSDKLYIANSNTTNPLIYGDFATSLLRVNGTLNINNAYTLPTVAGTANYVLQTNGAGVTSWVNPTSLSITETDPQVASTTTNFMPKWNGTSLVDGQIFDNGTKIGMGTNNPNWGITIRNDSNIFSSTNVIDQNKYALAITSNTGNDNEGIGIGFGNSSSGNQLGAGIVFKKQTVNSTGDLMFTIKTGQASFLPHYPAITIKGETANVGIGTVSPTQGKLVVSGSDNFNLTYGFLNSSGGTGTSSGSNGYSIYATHRIAASEFNAFSDVRIKNIIGVTNTENDLATLANIRITDYKLIDSLSKGNKTIKKVIAQELALVYPQAVSMHTDVIPDIYKQAEMVHGFIPLATQLIPGEKVKIIFSTGEELLEVTEVTPDGFRVNSNQSERVFVYGKEVNDFHTVDYEALTTLNISATQELLKRIEILESIVASLSAENSLLKTENSAIQTLRNDMNILKDMVMQNLNQTQVNTQQ